jgi:hypothetical protein
MKPFSDECNISQIVIGLAAIEEGMDESIVLGMVKRNMGILNPFDNSTIDSLCARYGIVGIKRKKTYRGDEVIPVFKKK